MTDQTMQDLVKKLLSHSRWLDDAVTSDLLLQAADAIQDMPSKSAGVWRCIESGRRGTRASRPSILIAK